MCQILRHLVVTLYVLYLLYWVQCSFASDTIHRELPPGYNNPWNRGLEFWRTEDECRKDCEFGTLLQDSCECICKNGWRGDECDEKCIDAIGEDKCKAYEKVCKNVKYEKWLRAHCPATCQFCEKYGPSSEGFVCGLQCSHPGGVLNQTTCECECHTGWTGDFCEDKCFDLNERCPLWTARQCNNSVVLRNCPEMCETCVKFGPGSPGFVCLLDCVNGGTLITNDNECRCECQPGWEGEQCEVLCQNHFPLCQPDPSQPGRGSYNVQMCEKYAFVLEKCRKLCGVCEAIGPGSPGFECTLSCTNGGMLVNNATDCYCACTPDWKGVTCSEPCTDARSGCSNILYACTHPRYVNYMKARCAKTCGFCISEKDFGSYFIVHGETPRSSETMALLRIPDEASQYGAGIELAILLDASGSTGFSNFHSSIQILIEYLGHLDYQASGGIRVAIIPFSSTTPISLNLFDSDSLARVLRKLEKAPYQGSRSDINAGLKAIKKKIFVHTRWQARCVLIILTDGLFTGDEPFETAEELRSLGVEIYAISMNDIYIESSLLRLTGDEQHIGLLHSVEDLPNLY